MPMTFKSLLIRMAVAAAVLGVILAVCLLIGSEPVSLAKALHGPWLDGQVNIDYEILFRFRLPRVLLAAIIGAALAAAGCVFQAVLRNPLADPYILGVSSGAGLGAMIAAILGWTWSMMGLSAMMLAAFIGALGTTWLVWLIGRTAGRANITALLLAGVVVNAFFSAMMMFLASIARATQVQSAMFWLMGSISQMQQFEVVGTAALLVALAVYGLIRLGPSLNMLSFGPEDAAALGLSISKVCFIAFAVSALITSAAVCLGGLIGFVGLIVPHAVRLVAGPDHRQLIPVSALVGGAFVALADTVARVVVAPAMLPVGVVTALAGGPFFLILLVRYTRNVHWGIK